MTTQPNAAPEVPSARRQCTNGIVADSALYGRLRRELWGNRSIYIAPLAAGRRLPVLFPDQPVLGPRGMRGMMGATVLCLPIVVLAMRPMPAAMLLMLHVPRGDLLLARRAARRTSRSQYSCSGVAAGFAIFTTVLSKRVSRSCSAPAAFRGHRCPATHPLLLLRRSRPAGERAGAATPWAPPLFEMQLVSLYGMIVLVLWHAPIYCLVSSGLWMGTRCNFVWAVLPPMAIAVVELLAFHTSNFGSRAA